MDFIPEPLRGRFGDDRANRLVELVRLIEREVRRVYDIDSRAYDPSIGDNALLFGLGIWHHKWFFIEGELEDWSDLVVSHEDNSRHILFGPLKIGVYKGGDYAEQSILDFSLNGSTTKEDYARRNQLQLFPFEHVDRPEDERAYELDSLCLVHFGNPRDGLVGLYIGAPAIDDVSRHYWAWYRRIDLTAPEDEREEEPVTPPPFDEQPEPALELEVRDEPGEQVHESAGE